MIYEHNDNVETKHSPGRDPNAAKQSEAGKMNSRIEHGVLDKVRILRRELARDSG
jgi:hypothetical protein